MKRTLLFLAIFSLSAAIKAQQVTTPAVPADTLAGVRTDTIKVSFQEIGKFPKSEIRLRLGYVIVRTEFWKVKGRQPKITGYLYADRKHRGKYTIVEQSIIEVK